jgi:tetratricopeptide (TPR) repeat protein
MLYPECQIPPVRIVFLCALLCLSGILIGCGRSTAAFLAKGEESLQKRKFTDALKQFRSAAESEPGSAAAHWGMARAYENLGQLEQTMDELRNTVELDGTNLDAKAKLGSYFLMVQPPLIPEAEKLRDQILAVNDKFVEARILNASILAVQNRPDSDVENIINAAIDIDPARVETYVSLARFFMTRNKAQQAESAIRRAIDRNPGSSLGHIEYGKFLTYTSRDPEADTEFHKAINIDPTNIPAREALAEFYVTSRQYELAENTYTTIVQMQENSPESRLELADFYTTVKKDDQAMSELRGIISDSPEFVAARYKLGKILLDRRDIAGVNEQVDALLAINDEDAEALMLRAKLKIQQNQSEDAAVDLAGVLKKYPSNRDALFLMAQVRLSLVQIDEARIFISDLERYHPTYLRTQLLKIQAAVAAGENENALKLANALVEKTTLSAQKLGADISETQDLRLRALTSRGLINLDLGKVPEARTDLQEVAVQSPRSAEAMVNVAKVQIREHDYPAALQTYENALAADPHSFSAMNGFVNMTIQLNQTARGHSKTDEWLAANAETGVQAALHFLKSTIFLAEKNSAAAEQELLRSIELDGSYLPAYSAYANLLVNQNRSDEAIAQYRKVVEKRPAAQAYTMLGILEDGLGRSAEAEQHYRKALEIAPGMPIAANNLAWLLTENNGNLDEALQLATTAVNKNQTIAGYHDTLGEVFLKKGLYSPAVEQFKKAVALDESNSQRKGTATASNYRVRLGIAMARVGDRSAARRSGDASQLNID